MATDVIQHCLGVDILNALLVECAIEGDDAGARRALALGADPKASDASRRTALTCALTGESWKAIGMMTEDSFMSEARLDTLRMIVGHPEMSIYNLNAPQESLNGVTVLGMAAWLNLPSAVEVLLGASNGRLLVDAIDAHGASPLMYAGRDGNLKVVQWLLAYGARPDVRDLHSRTAIQFALGHPRVLWLCEGALRRWRTRDVEKRKLSPSAQPHTDALLSLVVSSFSSEALCTPPSADYFQRSLLIKSTDTLISSIKSVDIPLLHSLLFPQPPSISPSSTTLTLTSDPLLVNLPDADGWSAVHHCVSVPNPSIEALDALYRAGAEISLFTRREQWTPLHCLAHRARNWDWDPVVAGNMYKFVMHLVKDLRAPLEAQDENEDTCIHIAAEHGENIEVLMALLDCDTEGNVRRMKNAQGLTALDIANPRYKALLGGNANLAPERPASALSVRTLKAPFSHSCKSSLSNSSVYSLAQSVTPALPQSTSTESNADSEAAFILAQGILDNLSYVSRSARECRTPDKVDELLHTLEETAKKSKKVFEFYAARAEEATREIEEVRQMYNKVTGLRASVQRKVQEKSTKKKEARTRETETWEEIQTLRDQRPRSQTTDSGDSQTTAVSRLSSASSAARGSSRSETGSVIYKDRGVATTPHLVQIIGSDDNGPPRRRLVQLPAWLDAWMANTPSPRRRGVVDSVREIEDDSSSIRHRSRSRAGSAARDWDSRSSIFHSGGEDGWKSDVTSAGATKLRAWLKKKIGPERSSKLDIVMDLNVDGSAVGCQVKDTTHWQDSVCSTVSRRRHPLPDVVKGQWQTSERLQRRALRECNIVLDTAQTDLDNIAECLKAADQFVISAQRSSRQTERMVSQAIQSRGSALQSVLKDIEASTPENASLGSELRRSFPADLNVLGAFASARTSVISLVSTLTDGEDEDTRFLRKFMTRKIVAKLDGAFDEVDKSYTWLRLVRDVLVNVKRQTRV